MRFIEEIDFDHVAEDATAALLTAILAIGYCLLAIPPARSNPAPHLQVFEN